jgi:alanine dehydrogenase
MTAGRREEIMKTVELTLGMIGTSTKENEKRVAIHPADFPRFDARTRKNVFVEKGYGKQFRIGDDEIEPHVAGLMEREELFEKCDAVMIFKPTAKDFPFLRDGQVLWGAVHCIQNEDIVQLAIDKKLTYIAMEYMYLWKSESEKDVWIFHTQSELAGYCSVLHALQLLGTKGWHDQPKKAAIISFGTAGRGAVHALQAMDFTDITAYTMRNPISVLWPLPGVKHRKYSRKEAGSMDVVCEREDGSVVSFGEELSGYDIIVNCVFQDTDRPLMFVHNREKELFKKGTLIVDVSCDRGMGFEFARPTSFNEPIFEAGNGIVYYAVDHSPSYLFNTASLEHSKTAWPFVKDVVGGREAWKKCLTIEKAIDIENGVIVNPRIISFQKREKEYPHNKLV